LQVLGVPLVPHTHTHPSKRLAHPRSPIPPLSTLTSRATHAHPTSPRSTGFCATWDCISSSSSSAVWDLGPAAPRRDGVHERAVVCRRASSPCPNKLFDAAAESADGLVDRRGIRLEWWVCGGLWAGEPDSEARLRRGLDFAVREWWVFERPQRQLGLNVDPSSPSFN